jgi:glutathione peroxidase-family protein
MHFLSKMDVNGSGMHNLYKFLKRYSPLFVHKYGRSRHINDYYHKFLTNRYGEVKYYYGPQTEYAMIEQDIKRLLTEKFFEQKYKELLDPPDVFI